MGTSAIQWLSEDEFRKAATQPDAKPLEGVGIRKSLAVEFKSEAADKPIQIAISCSSPDRSEDTLALSGWQLADYKSNPVILWMHDRTVAPLGIATKLWPEGDKLMAEVKFSAVANPSAPMDGPRAEALIREGTLRGASVGFRPLAYAPRKDANGSGISFTSMALVEFSLCTVPAHPQALVTQKADAVANPIEQLILKAPVPASTADRLEACVSALTASLATHGEHLASHKYALETLASICERFEKARPSDDDDPDEEDPDEDDPDNEEESLKTIDPASLAAAVVVAVCEQLQALENE